MKQEILRSQWHHLDLSKSPAPRCRQMTMPVCQHSIFLQDG